LGVRHAIGRVGGLRCFARPWGIGCGGCRRGVLGGERGVDGRLLGGLRFRLGRHVAGDVGEMVDGVVGVLRVPELEGLVLVRLTTGEGGEGHVKRAGNESLKGARGRRLHAIIG
jgi:hypothetical protein